MTRSRILLAAVAIVAILVACFFILSRHASKPLTYQGRPIEYWFAQLPITPLPPPGVLGTVNIRGFIKSAGQQYGSTNLLDDGSLSAIAAFGTNALPFLLARLQGLDSVIEKQIRKVATNTGVAYLPFRKAELERLQAVTGLIHVKTLTPEAREFIMALRTNRNFEIAAAAAYVLKRRALLGDSASVETVKSGAANGSQPFRSETNRTASAAGSRR